MSSARVDGEAPPRLYRVVDGRVLAGVASGLAGHLGVDVLVVRLAFLLLAAAGGAGVAMYAAFWILAPLALEPAPTRGPARRRRSGEFASLVALGSVVLGSLLFASALGVDVSGPLVLPAVVVSGGVVLLWRQADDGQRARWRAATASSRWSGVVRTLLGLVLVGSGGIAFLVGRGKTTTARDGLVAAGVVLVGLALVSGPFWLRMARDLSAERAARIREQERAEVAAHVHDSVLHTLTLIQRHVHDPREVTRLARAQERELRGWLYRPVADPRTTLKAGLERVAADVEDDHGVAVEVVVVGDAPLDEGLGALLQAAREALVNAAKYAGSAPISVFAEVEPSSVTVFVRDRGPGFDIDAVPADRLGIRQSVVGRMTRHGGTATVRSSADEGTEVQLDLPRSPS